MRSPINQGLDYAALTDKSTFAQNKRGVITPAQEQRISQMVRNIRGTAVMGLVGVLIVPVFAATSLLNMGPLPPAATMAQATFWIPLLLFGVVLLMSELFLAWWALRSWRIVWASEADLRQRQVAVGEGHVRWGKGLYNLQMYTVELDGRTLRTPALTLQLPPGRYRCAYLATSGWLLSAVPLEAPTGAAPDHATLAVIARQHGFRPADLELNRVGQPSPRQRARKLGSAGVFGLGTLLLALLGMVLSATAPPAAITRPLSALLLFGLCGLIPGALVLRHLRDLRAPRQILSVSGRLRIDYQVRGRTVRVFYRIGQISLRLSEHMVFKQAYNSVIDNQSYCINYWSVSHTIASLEPLDPAVPPAR